MRQIDETKYVKRTQKDYTYSFKLQVVQDGDTGHVDPPIPVYVDPSF
jgi:hypothetical protein